MNATKTVAVVGAGAGGLAVAVRLATRGYRVTVFDANPYAGGKLAQIEQDGYRFDAGPSLFTMPQLVEELFAVAGRPVADYFQYHRLDEVCRYFYEDGTRLTAWADPERFAAEVAAHTNETAERVRTFLARSAEYYRLVGELFLYRSLNDPRTFLNRTAAEAIGKLPRLGVFSTMHEANERYFHDPRVVQLFNRFATYNGSDPYQTPALLNIIPHLEHNLGAYYPKGGMYAIPQSLARLAEDLGVTFRLGTPVEGLETSARRVTGVRAAGRTEAFDVVVSNADVVSTYRRLLPHVPPPRRLLSQPKSSSALIFYWGVARRFEALGLHNIFFSQDYRTEFEAIFRHRTVGPDPTVYVNISAKMEEADAPPGCENWFTMVNVPNNDGQPWDDLIERTRARVFKKMSRMLGVDLPALVRTEAVLDPRSIEARTSSAQGALYGNSSNNRYAAFLRHANFSSRFGNLFFCGGSVHPGGGIPLALLSARIADGLVAKRFGAGRRVLVSAESG